MYHWISRGPPGPDFELEALQAHDSTLRAHADNQFKLIKFRKKSNKIQEEILKESWCWLMLIYTDWFWLMLILCRDLLSGKKWTHLLESKSLKSKTRNIFYAFLWSNVNIAENVTAHNDKSLEIGNSKIWPHRVARGTKGLGYWAFKWIVGQFFFIAEISCFVK